MNVFRISAMMIAGSIAFIAMQAVAAEKLDCVNSGYGNAEQAVLDNFTANFSVQSWATGGPPANVLDIIKTRVQTCSATHGWSPEAAQHALLYKLSSVGLAGLEKNGPLTPTQIGQLQGALNADDEKRIRAIFDAMANAQREGKSIEAPSQSADLFIGKLILRSGIPATPANSRAAGGWIAAKVMCERYAEFFAAD